MTPFKKPYLEIDGTADRIGIRDRLTVNGII